ncbi:MAG: hypothetical protein C4547_06295 [Phycisphaerales bacterium]|nr:MAG: hypothetical protein C4547_06295 [Phycisphaerales bacterium]
MIQLSGPLPFAEGQRVNVSIVPDESTDDSEPPFGSPQALLKAMHEPPHLDPTDVDLLERLIKDARLPSRREDIFQDEEGG